MMPVSSFLFVGCPLLLQLLRYSLIVSSPGPNRWQFSSIPASTYRNQSQAPKEAKRSHWNLHSSRFATWISSSVTGSRQFEKALSPQVQSRPSLPLVPPKALQCDSEYTSPTAARMRTAFSAMADGTPTGAVP